ncbi:hypothetical protein TNCV_2669331 [Trichonephila clavipes]|nr:hypothetical protein TNCV_2669331 [Trichonephila clavipes]
MSASGRKLLFLPLCLSGSYNPGPEWLSGFHVAVAGVKQPGNKWIDTKHVPKSDAFIPSPKFLNPRVVKFRESPHNVKVSSLRISSVTLIKTVIAMQRRPGTIRSKDLVMILPPGVASSSSYRHKAVGVSSVVVWRGLPIQVSSSSIDLGSKLRGRSPLVLLLQNATLIRGHVNLRIKVIDSCQAGHEFEPSTAEESPCSGGGYVQAQTSSRWCDVGEGVPAQVSFLSLD